MFMIRLAYLWTQPTTRWAVAGLLTVLAMVALATGAWRWHSDRHALASALIRQQAAEQAASSATPTASSHSSAADFVLTLPRQHDVPALLESVRLALSQQQLRLLSLQVQPAPAEAQQLSRVDVLLRAQGSYGNAKQMLGDLAGRYPGLTVPRLRLRSGATGVPGVTDMEATLSFWSQPAPAAGAPR
jgi:Tfp pilus assembly protein PilO